MARSLNKVQLIGNLTRDPELRYTPSGAAVCTFGIATNRQWTTDQGDKKEDVEFHRIVVWNKLAELCAQLLGKGRKVFVEGRLQTRRWQTQDGQDRTTTEVVITDMIILDSRGASGGYEDEFDMPEIEDMGEEEAASASEGKTNKQTKKDADKPSKKSTTSKTKKSSNKKNDETSEQEDDDIPF